MIILDRQQIQDSLDSDDPESLFVEPLLEKKQVGSLTLDLRLGYDFLVSILTRKSSIVTVADSNSSSRAIHSYFQETRRELGEIFILYPHQIVLGTSLEYVSLPKNIYADILSRSSYNRLGISFNNMIQPGFRGCVPLELFNHGNSPVELVVGSRICQARLFKIETATEYIGENKRKYYGNIRPAVSNVHSDNELQKLVNIKRN